MISSPSSLVLRSRSGFDDERFGLVHDLLQFTDRHRALLAGAQQAIEHLLAIELFAAPVLLYHHVRDFVDPLVGGEALAALQALAAAPDGLGFLTLARVDYLVIGKTAKRTFHGAGAIFEIVTVEAVAKGGSVWCG